MRPQSAAPLAGDQGNAAFGINGDTVNDAATDGATQASTFGRRFLDEFSDIRADEVKNDIGVARKRAARVLKGVHWKFIPYRTCERRRFVGLKTLLLVCCILDDEEVGASPGNVTTDQVHIAWSIAGWENWLKAAVLNEMRMRADREVLSKNPDLVCALIAKGWGK